MGQSGSRIKVTETDRAMLQLKMAKDELHRYSRRTELLIRREREELKELCAKLGGNKVRSDFRARAMLKRVHYQQRLLEQCSDQIINLETMVQSIEFKMVEKNFLTGLENGNELLKRLNKELSLEKVERVIDDAAEQIEIQREIDETLSNAVIGSSISDEIDRELELLDQQVNGDKVTKIVENMPSLDGLSKLREKEAEDQADGKETSLQEAPASKSSREEPLLA